MDLLYKNQELGRACSVYQESVRSWGERRAAVVRRRIAQMMAADNLAVLSTLPPLDLMAGEQPDEFLIDALSPYRLVFAPWHDPIPRRVDGGLDLEQVTTLRILAVKEHRGH